MFILRSSNVIPFFNFPPSKFSKNIHFIIKGTDVVGRAHSDFASSRLKVKSTSNTYVNWISSQIGKTGYIILSFFS